MAAKRVCLAITALFVVSLAVVIGKRMSAEAMAVVIGVIFGVAASIPTSLLIVAATRRAQEREADQLRSLREQQRSVPPVIVVSPSGGQAMPWFSPLQVPSMPDTLDGLATRRFRVVGDEETVLDGPELPGDRRRGREWIGG